MAASPPATLEDLERLTTEINEAQSEVNRLSEERKRVIRDLDAQGVDYKVMADRMRVTVATVYRIVPKGRRASE